MRLVRGDYAAFLRMAAPPLKSRVTALELNGEAIAPAIASVIATADLVDFLIPLIIPHFGIEDFDFFSSFAALSWEEFTDSISLVVCLSFAERTRVSAFR